MANTMGQPKDANSQSLEFSSVTFKTETSQAPGLESGRQCLHQNLALFMSGLYCKRIFILPHANDKAMPFSMSPSLRPPWNRKQSPIVVGEWAVRDLPSVYLSALVEKGEFQGCLMKQGDGR